MLPCLLPIFFIKQITLSSQHMKVLAFNMEFWRTGENDYDPEVGSFHDLMTFGATFVLKTSLYLLQKVSKLSNILNQCAVSGAWT